MAGDLRRERGIGGREETGAPNCSLLANYLRLATIYTRLAPNPLNVNPIHTHTHMHVRV